MNKVYIRTIAYNAEKTLARTIKSVLRQTHSDFYYYLCDNGSTDRTGKIVDEYAAKDSRIVPFHNKENFVWDGNHECERLPSAIADDDYYCVIDADDEFYIDYIEKMIAFLVNNNLDIAACGCDFINRTNCQLLSRRTISENLILQSSMDMLASYPVYHSFFRAVWGKLYRGSTLKTYPFIDTDERYKSLDYGGDTYTCFLALRQAGRIGLLNGSFYKYYMSPMSNSYTFNKQRILSDRILFDNAIDFLQSLGSISQRNWDFMFLVYMNALKDTIAVLLKSKIDGNEKLGYLLEIFNFKYTKQLAARNDFCVTLGQGVASQQQRNELFKAVADYLLALEEVPDDMVDEFCKIGEFVCAAAEYATGWLAFRKLYASYLTLQNRDIEAAEILSELAQLIPSEVEIAQSNETVDVETLQNETDFVSYIQLLRYFGKNYTVMIAAQETCWGEAVTDRICSEMMTIGLEADLYGKLRHSYAAIIDCGKLIFEKLSESKNISVQWQGKIGGIKIKLESRGFEIPPVRHKIEIGDCDYALTNNLRGLHFVVYDKNARAVLDDVVFDVFAESITCRRTMKLADDLRAFSNMHPEAYVLIFKKPEFPKGELSKTEKFIQRNLFGLNDSLGLLEHTKLPLRRFFTDNSDIIEAITPPKYYYDASGVRRFEDVCGRVVNCVAGHRITTDQPKEYDLTVFLVGGSAIFGIGASDTSTIASHLQRLFNENAPEHHVIVQNYGYSPCEMERQNEEEISILNSLPIKLGDIVICDFGFNSGLPLLDMSNEAKRPHTYGEIFFDQEHLTGNGYNIIAEKLFENIIRRDNSI